MGRRWTEQDVDELKDMARRYPTPKIAEKIDRTVAGVVFKAHQLKISLRSRGQAGAAAIDPGAGFGLQE